MTIEEPLKLFKKLMFCKQFLELELRRKKSDQIVINYFRKCGFHNKAQDGVVQTLDQDEDEEFTNMIKQLIGDNDLMIM